mmetsp:Transcript_30744/g.35475  ORF Transcript_30744/g.35475 Transcript_30744/m.35475 type:complete len:585 (-) Transcript_30744:154-1908(-)
MSSTLPALTSPAPTAFSGLKPSFPSLQDLCLQAVSLKIEKIHPSNYQCLEQPQWELIVQHRHTFTLSTALKYAKQQTKNIDVSKTTNFGGIDGTGRVTPAINAKCLLAIESCNQHLATSEVTDDLCWKDCTNYKFKQNGPNRPKVLMMPWPMLVDRIQRAADEILECFNLSLANDVTSSSAPSSMSGGMLLHDMISGMASNKAKHEKARKTTSWIDKSRAISDKYYVATVIDNAIVTLEDAPMSVSLLTASGIGKSMKKIIKLGKKHQSERLRKKEDESDKDTDDRDSGDDQKSKAPDSSQGLDAWLAGVKYPITVQTCNATSTQWRQPQTLDLCESLLSEWKKVASESGVNMSTSHRHDTGSKQPQKDDIMCKVSGRHKHTSLEQHESDVQTVQSCDTWRSLYKALVDREAHSIAHHGAKMKKMRENLEAGRSKISKVKLRTATVQYKQAKTLDRYDSILSGSRGANGMARAAGAATMTASAKKMAQMRKETRVATSFGKASLKQLSSRGASGFGCSVASATGQAPRKRSLSNSVQPTVTVSCGKRKQMTMPSKNEAAVNLTMRQKGNSGLSNLKKRLSKSRR